MIAAKLIKMTQHCPIYRICCHSLVLVSQSEEGAGWPHTVTQETFKKSLQWTMRSIAEEDFATASGCDRKI